MKRYAELMGNHKINGIKSLLDNKLLGRLAVLSCVDVATVISYYNNVKYTYMMYKNNNGINIDKVSEQQGNFKDGMEITMEGNVSSSTIAEAIEKLIMFDKLYVQYDVAENLSRDYSLNNTITKFNDRKFMKFKTFCVCTNINSCRYRCSIGNVLYEVPSNLTGSLRTSGIIAYVPVGTVDIVPSREALQFTDRTNKVITDAFENVKKELKEITSLTFNNQNFTLAEYYDKTSNDWYSIVEDTNRLQIYFDDVKEVFDTCNMTIDGVIPPKNYLKYLKEIRWNIIPKEAVYMNSSTKGRSGGYLKDIIRGNIKCFKKTSNIIKSITKEWFAEQHPYTNYIVLRPEYLNGSALGIDTVSSWSGIDNVKECATFTLQHLNIEEFCNEDVPQEYLDSHKTVSERTSKKILSIDKTRIPCRMYSYYRGGYCNDNLNMKAMSIIFYAQNTKEDAELRDFAEFVGKFEGVRVVTVKSEYLPLFEADKKCISLSSITLVKNNFIAKCVTYVLIRRQLSKNDYSYLPIAKEFFRKYTKYQDHMGNTYSDFVQNIIEVYTENRWYNEYDVKYFNISNDEKKVLDYQYKIQDNLSLIGEAMVYKKFGSNPKLGIKTPRINLSNYL